MNNTGKVDTQTINGLLAIMGESIAEVREHGDDDQVIKKNNAIKGSVDTVCKIYGLAFDKTRLNYLDKVKYDNEHYYDKHRNPDVSPADLMGDVAGQGIEQERIDALKAKNKAERKARPQKMLDHILEVLNDVVDDPKQESDGKGEKYYKNLYTDYGSYRFNDSDIEVLNRVLDTVKNYPKEYPDGYIPSEKLLEQLQFIKEHITIDIVKGWCDEQDKLADEIMGEGNDE